ncbi:DUF2089 domain-containing protein [Bacteroidales bacterium OttesenSCG-928-I14]|nr:DUF2089 domain-containing protein [Bacteroidales bacterium OttesenSCG-928-I14]
MKLPCKCPSCDSQLMITGLKCLTCNTEVSGSYDLPLLARLTKADQEFILNFVKNSGSLKEMSKVMGLSYPTVRNILDEIINKIETYENT